MKNMWSRYLAPLFTWRTLLAFIVGGVIFGALGWFIPSPFEEAQYGGGVLFQSSNPNNYQFIDPLLSCEIGPESAFTDITPLRDTLSKQIVRAVDSGKAQHVSVYFRSLGDAHWFDINPNDTYAPASLLKLFVMMAYYKESRDWNDPSVLTRPIVFKGSPNPVADDSPGANIPHLTSGASYPVQDIIKQMIVYSDNDALNTLIANFTPHTTSSLGEIFSDLQINSPLTNENNYFMTVDQYAMTFRVLYSSTYLNRKLSEQALATLAQADYKSALVAGLPSNIVVAHKFGVTTIPATGSGSVVHELHDCGIVYYPGHPYLLCIMTAGSDFTALEGVIASLSDTTYQSVGKLYSK